MLFKEIVAFGQNCVIACDGKCEKAFGINGRPKVQLSNDDDDYCFLSDNEVGIAPESGKTKIVAEGGEQKPITSKKESLLNKWCFRECERCVSATTIEEIKLYDFSKRKYNQPFKHDSSKSFN